ncbi:hypothetical protein L6307_05165 [Candidatus Parcubacteria bacterium]|nr:hypothetical protein [Candidatus Parcubacteria bacterium]MCG2700082.1 hypothetical protein [Candidatus Parcubacteria bacterium]
MENLKMEFEKDMWESYDEIKKVYNPTIFYSMLKKYGGIETAKRLLAPKNSIQYGLKKLDGLNKLHLSVEYLVLRDKYKSLFTKQELEIAKWRLESFDYIIDKII